MSRDTAYTPLMEDVGEKPLSLSSASSLSVFAHPQGYPFEQNRKLSFILLCIASIINFILFVTLGFLLSRETTTDKPRQLELYCMEYHR